MQVIHEIEEARHWVRTAQQQGQRVGVVPTMGALHAGHLSLVHAARQSCDAVAVTIFVNPTQFAPHEDLQRYPRTLKEDLQLLGDQAQMVFTPTPEQMYPPGFSTSVDPPSVARDLEGVARPHHFRGVATVVLKLLQILPAERAFFGQKDFQQLCVVQQMVRDLDVPVEIVPCPTLRDPDGLAMSSRNRYLSGQQRESALGLIRALRHTAERVASGQRCVAVLESEMQGVLAQHGIERIDYATVRDRTTLQPLVNVTGAAIALIAAHVGTTRLIDNWLLEVG
jgi:pantoate--beta-alanine ligase